jgi:hypothetical protein
MKKYLIVFVAVFITAQSFAQSFYSYLNLEKMILNNDTNNMNLFSLIKLDTIDSFIQRHLGQNIDSNNFYFEQNKYVKSFFYLKEKESKVLDRNTSITLSIDTCSRKAFLSDNKGLSVGVEINEIANSWGIVVAFEREKKQSYKYLEHYTHYTKGELPNILAEEEFIKSLVQPPIDSRGTKKKK